MHQRLFVAPILALFTVIASGQVTPVATGLNNPRGLAFGPGGVLYVAEAGLGTGNGAGGIGPGPGLTGSLGEIRDLSSANPTYGRIITGLASSAGPGGVVGPDGVSPLGNGGIHIIMAESTKAILADNPGVSTTLANEFGKLLKSSQSGQWRVVADVGDSTMTGRMRTRTLPGRRPGNSRMPIRTLCCLCRAINTSPTPARTRLTRWTRTARCESSRSFRIQC